MRSPEKVGGILAPALSPAGEEDKGEGSCPNLRLISGTQYKVLMAERGFYVSNAHDRCNYPPC
jgi:hypothetical protein